MFYFLLLTTDRMKEINQSNLSLNPIDCPYNDYRWLSSSDSPFIPSDLDFGFENKFCLWKTKVHFGNFSESFEKKAAEIPNSSLIRNVNYLITKMNVEQNDFAWIEKKKKRIDGSKNRKNRMSYWFLWMMFIHIFLHHLKFELWFWAFVL